MNKIEHRSVDVCSGARIGVQFVELRCQERVMSIIITLYDALCTTQSDGEKNTTSMKNYPNEMLFLMVWH